MSRRYFFEVLGTGAIAITVTGGGVFSWQYLSPNVLFEPSTTFKAGAPADYPPDSVTFLPKQKIFIVRAKEGYFYALSAVCTHLGCITNWKVEEGVISCPCHGSKFDKTGGLLTGPAPRPLPHFFITLDEGGNLIVDRGSIVGEDYILKI
jgi:cytochrome b6-f complex iron-sulfur subunit